MFVIVGGVVEFDFSRILKIVDEMCSEGLLDPKTTRAQTGHCSYVPHNFESYRFAPGETFHEDILNADAIITHGGVGTLVYALKAGKKVITFPRLKIYGEHLDNHQLDICTAFTQKGYCLMATNKEELCDCVKKIKDFSPKPFSSDNSMMSKILTDFIDSV